MDIDGRRFALHQCGDPHGFPLFVHHGTPGSRLASALIDETASKFGVRLISFDRPGYADAPLTPPSLASVGADTLAVADALGIDRFAVAGVSGGGPYALATALAGPERVTSVAVVAGIGPIRVIKPHDPDDPEREYLARADAGDVDGALASFRSDLAADLGDIPAIEDDTARIEAYLEGAPPNDFAWLDAGKKVWWGRDLREATRRLDGYARDNVAWGGDWDIDVTAVTVPVRLYYGDDDRLVPPSHGRWLAERIPGSVLVTIPGAGHGTAAFGRWDDILPALVRDRGEPT
jgi:pimeloyl-ACP methyl ester carboxylesterase